MKDNIERSEENLISKKVKQQYRFFKRTIHSRSLTQTKMALPTELKQILMRWCVDSTTKLRIQMGWL